MLVNIPSNHPECKHYGIFYSILLCFILCVSF